MLDDLRPRRFKASEKRAVGDVANSNPKQSRSFFLGGTQGKVFIFQDDYESSRDGVGPYRRIACLAESSFANCKGAMSPPS